ncbi:hypothetical protein [Lysinibacillus sp. LZ02]|uniref:hypothetical protein n=1 Tax=Lysinibacillus sp. LZ02 TaxID=3420668 RepID=UPI003D35FE6F
MDFTYTSFTIDHTFTVWQPIFRTIFIFSIIFLAVVIAKVIPTWITVLYAAFSSIIAGQLLYSTGIIIDAFVLNGNSSDTTIFIAICITNMISIFVSISKKPKER